MMQHYNKETVSITMKEQEVQNLQSMITKLRETNKKLKIEEVNLNSGKSFGVNTYCN